MANMANEVERKFYLFGEPDPLFMATATSVQTFRQIYVRHDSEGEERYRLIDGKTAVFTTKGKGDLSRPEGEHNVSLSEYFNARPLDSYHPIDKVRHSIPMENNLVSEIDVYQGRFAGHKIAEVEFTSEDEANAFTPPGWWGPCKEVTYDKRFKNVNLSKADAFPEPQG